MVRSEEGVEVALAVVNPALKYYESVQRAEKTATAVAVLESAECCFHRSASLKK